MDDEGGDWGLASFSTFLEKQSFDREKKRLEWEKKLGDPALFVPDPDSGEGHGFGYFKATWGVLIVRRYSNGYSMDDAMQAFTKEEICRLNLVLGSA